MMVRVSMVVMQSQKYTQDVPFSDEFDLFYRVPANLPVDTSGTYSEMRTKYPRSLQKFRDIRR